MSEEETVEEVVEDVVEETTPEEAVEEEARGKGWNPDLGEKSAQEFLDYEQEYSESKKADKKLKKENKDLKDRLNRLEGNQNIQIVEQRKFYESRIGLLEKNRDAAIEGGQGEMALEIQKQLDIEKEQLTQLSMTSTTPQPEMDTSVLDDWVENNAWIDDGSEKAQFAKDLFQELNNTASQNTPYNSPQSVIDAQWRRMLRQVNKEVAEEFGGEAPSKGARKTAPSRVKGKRTVDQAVSTRSVGKLRSEDKKMYKILVKSDTNPNGTYTSDEFFKELDKANAARGAA